MDEHHAAVNAIASKVKEFYDQKKPFRIYHGSTNSTRQLSFEKNNIIDTSHLTAVLRINRLKKTVLVEPNVSMENLVIGAMQSGFIPKVVMEFPEITVGGGFSGTSGESSSFKYGFFEDTVGSIEIVLANGEVTMASDAINPDLFEGARGSFGTLGVVTQLEVECIEAKSYVQVTHLPVSSVAEAMKNLEAETSALTNDYVDGILFSQKRGVIMSGRLLDASQVDSEIVRFSRAQDQWFYRYAEKRLADEPDTPFTIAVPLVDYLFRYDRGAFWAGKYAFEYFLTPYNRATRYLLDQFMHAKVMYHALHESGFAEKYIVQDIGFPSSTAGKFIEYLNQNFGFHPLWLCPLKKGHRYPLRGKAATSKGEVALRTEMILNIGVWGPGPTKNANFIAANRELEAKTRELHGMKCLYARTYYTEDEFWQIYDRRWYEGLRAKYNAQTLPSIYDKVKSDFKGFEQELEFTGIWQYWPMSRLPSFWDLWPAAGLYGVYRAALGIYVLSWSDYLLKSE